MRKIYLVMLLCSLTGFVFGQGIEFFEGTWEETLEKAKAEEKLIFVDAYTTWCGPCKRMAKNVFTQDAVGSVFNAKFINAKMDMEDEKNISFVSQYPVSAYPTLFFIDGDGKIIHKKVGGQQVDGLLAFANEAEKKDDRSVNFVEDYEAGKRDHDFVLGYVKALNKTGKPSLKISNEYLKSNPNLPKEQLIEFLFEAVTEVDTKLFDKMVANKKEMMTAFGEDRLKEKVRKAANKTVQKGIEFEIIDLAEEATNKFGQFHSKQETAEFALMSNMSFYQGTGQHEKYIGESEKYFKKTKKDNEKLNQILTGLVALKSNSKAKKLMLDVSKQMVKNEGTWRNLLTYSNALMLNDNSSKALEMAKKALDKAEKGQEKRAIQSVIDRIADKV